MIRLLAPLALVTLSACSGGFDFSDLRPTPTATPAVVVAPTPQPTMLTAKERLVGAIEDNGCELSADNASTILTQATISRDELVSLAQELAGEGRAEVSGTGAVRVITETCA